jgi:hypothetical protein
MAPRQVRPPAIDHIRLIPLPPVHEPAVSLDHLYFEIVYAPFLGPTATLLARNLFRHLGPKPAPAKVNPVELAQEVGIRASSEQPLGRGCRLRHALDRLAHDNVVQWRGQTDVGVHIAVPTLTAHAVAKLPATARRAHVALTSDLTHGRSPR